MWNVARKPGKARRQIEPGLARPGKRFTGVCRQTGKLGFDVSPALRYAAKQQMSSSFLKFRLITVLAGVALSVLVTADGQTAQPRRGVPIQFSEPKRDTVTTNLSQSTTKKPALEDLEEDLKKPFEFFNINNSLSGVPLPPAWQQAGPVVPSKRAKELLEKRRYWFLLTGEELFGVPKAEDIFKVRKYGPDGAEEKEKSPVERFYERQDNAKADGTNQVGTDSLRGLMSALEGLDGQRARDGFGASSNGVSETSQTLQRLFDSASDRPLLGDTGAAGGFQANFGRSSPAASEWTRTQQERRKEFDQILNPGSALAPPAGTLNSLAGSADLPARAPVFNLDAYSGSGQRDSLGQFSSGLSTSLRPPSMPEMATMPAYPSLTPTLPQPAQPDRLLPPPPPFAIPKRKF